MKHGRATAVVARLLQILLVLFGVSVIIFVLVRVLPGDPIAAALGDRASKAQIEQLRSEMGVDRPILEQYVHFITGVFQGRMGLSLIERRDVAEIIMSRLPATLELVIVALMMAIAVGVPLGVLSGVHRNSAIDHVSRLTALGGVSFPQFWMGIMLQLLLGSFLALLPITGRIAGPPPTHITGLFLLDSVLTLNGSAFVDSLRHILAPAAVLAVGPLANITRLIRANMIDELGKAYPEFLNALGVHPFIVNYKHVLRNAFSSTLTIIGFLIPILIGSSFVVEKVFAWPGLARFGADAIIASDFNGVVGVTLTVCLFVVVVNAIVEELYAVLDPRVALGKKA